MRVGCKLPEVHHPYSKVVPGGLGALCPFLHPEPPHHHCDVLHVGVLHCPVVEPSTTTSESRTECEPIVPIYAYCTYVNDYAYPYHFAYAYAYAYAYG